MLGRTKPSIETEEDRNHRLKLIRDLTIEVVPMKSLDDAIAALPEHSEVSVTCSPAKGIETTMLITDELRAAGHSAIPHISARMVEGPDHVRRIAEWFRREQIGRMFLVGGDADPPAGPYDNATAFLRDLLDAGPELHTVGIPSYPDGHALIPTEALDAALLAKQEVLAEAGLHGYASTQMCFNPSTIISWLDRERARGLTLPVHLGIAGVLDRAKLVSMGARLGIGTSLSYLKKNRKAIGKLMTQVHYDPNDLLEPMSPHLSRLDVTGIHCFTFNQVASTEEWRRAVLADA
jgi:methylenetetrahydrofolate reductase (NADPH)